MKIAILQLNPTVGDLAGNARKILDAHAEAARLGADLAVTTELALIGYPPKDLLDREHFVDDALRVLGDLVARVRGPALLLGTVDRNPGPGKPLHNVALLVADGRIVHRHAKCLLPTYDVFDESRYFEPGGADAPAAFGGRKLGITVCEDMWTVVTDPATAPARRDPAETYQTDPVKRLAAAGADLLINLSASPFAMGKPAAREKLLRAQAASAGRPFLYVNQAGGNDDLVFDGNSIAMTADGTVAARGPAFAEGIVLWNTEESAPAPEPPALNQRSAPPSGVADHGSGQDDVDMVYQALVLGTRDYVRKGGFARAVVGLSGGIDSALVACIAADALGPANVLGVSMPSRFSSEGSRTDAFRLAANLGIGYQTVPVDRVFQSYLDTLAPAFEGRPPGLAEENLQARIRGATLMAFSNKFGHLVLTTGNKSELATGYCTLYGDMCGGLAVISDVPKTLVYRLAREVVNRDRERIPDESIRKPPSAELRPDQKDSDSLPEYDVLDPILKLYVEDALSPAEIVRAGHDPATVAKVIRLVDANEYKRRQAAPGVKVTGKAFGSGRRFPIAQGYRPT